MLCVMGQGRPVRLHLTAVQVSDFQGAGVLLSGRNIIVCIALKIKAALRLACV